MPKKTMMQKAEAEAKTLVGNYNIMYLILLTDALERLTRKKMDKMNMGKC